MKVLFTNQALNNLKFWEKNDKRIIKKIILLIEDIKITPYIGIGKPEQLKHNLKKCYSRRINKEHRLVYKVKNNTIIIYSCRFHYE